jgi:hypothetical protein
MIPHNARFIIGIDPGTNTGFAIYDRQAKHLIEVRTVSAHEAWDKIRRYKTTVSDQMYIRWEDCRKREWFGKAGRERLKGVGSVERDCSLWQEFLTREGLSNEAVAPKDTQTKVSADYFMKLTKWPKTGSQHSRDAAMLCYGF